MRVIGQIPHPSLRITIMHMNDKYIVRLEAGPMEQLFKFDQTRYPSLEAVQQLVDEEFLRAALERFNAMFLSMKSAMQKHPGKE